MSQNQESEAQPNEPPRHLSYFKLQNEFNLFSIKISKFFFVCLYVRFDQLIKILLGKQEVKNRQDSIRKGSKSIYVALALQVVKAYYNATEIKEIW